MACRCLVERGGWKRGEASDVCRPRHAGFTLIELLVVIAILALLLSLLTPSLQQARLLAIKAKCQGIEHTMGTAVLHYLNDWDRCFPRQAPMWMFSLDRPGPSWTRPPRYSAEGLGDYLDDEARRFRCKGAIETGWYAIDPDRRIPMGKVMPTYTVNRTIFPWDGNTEIKNGGDIYWDRCAQKLQRVQFPHRSWVFADGDWRGVFSCVHLHPTREGRFFWKSHFDGVNVTYLDGSVRWVHSDEYLHWRDWPGGINSPPRNEEYWAAMRSWYTMWD